MKVRNVGQIQPEVVKKIQPEVESKRQASSSKRQALI
jgi:hypothetical protein